MPKPIYPTSAALALNGRAFPVMSIVSLSIKSIFISCHCSLTNHFPAPFTLVGLCCFTNSVPFWILTFSWHCFPFPVRPHKPCACCVSVRSSVHALPGISSKSVFHNAYRACTDGTEMCACSRYTDQSFSFPLSNHPI